MYDDNTSVVMGVNDLKIPSQKVNSVYLPHDLKYISC